MVFRSFQHVLCRRALSFFIFCICLLALDMARLVRFLWLDGLVLGVSPGSFTFNNVGDELLVGIALKKMCYGFL